MPSLEERTDILRELAKAKKTNEKVESLVRTACTLLAEPALEAEFRGILWRLSQFLAGKHKTARRSTKQPALPYPMLLYDRFLAKLSAAREYRTSELMDAALEVRIEETLDAAGVSYRKTKRAERVSGFDQAPDFIIPSEFNPQVVIEAKITQDDGTARDKVTRVQHLSHLSQKGRPEGTFRYEVAACIGGRGFGIRREDMRKLLLATRGKVFTLKNLDRLVECTRLNQFRSN